MKSLKLLFSLLFLSMFLLTSCDDDEPETEHDILGDWKIESMDYTVTSSVSGEVAGQVIDQTSVTEGQMQNSEAFINFTEEAYITSGSYDIEAMGTTNDPINGSTTTDFSSSISDLNGSGTYSRNVNELTFVGTFIEFDFEVVEFDLGGFDFGGIDLGGLGIELPDIEFAEFDLEDQESIARITDFNGDSMTMVFDTDDSSVEQGITNSTKVNQTLVLIKQ